MPDYIRWLRGRIGPRKTILAYATALIRDADGRLLFQRRTDFDWWGLPGGIVELGETFRDCAVREAEEETGLHVEPQRLIGVYASPEWDFQYPTGDEVQQFTVAIECRVIGGQLQADGHESTLSQFFPLNDPPTPCPPWYTAMIRDLKNKSHPYFDPPIITSATDSFLWPLREAVGAGRIILMSAGAVIQDTQGRVLLGLRSDTHTWGLPAGLMELGETPAGTLVREAYEELQLRIRPTQLVGVFTGPRMFHTYPDGNQVQLAATLFRAEIVEGTPIPDGTETLAADWFDLATLPPMPPRHHWMLQVALVHPEGGRFE
ncbi:MAG: NUDIX domain-containing protein [Deltaproteobacteria bacterium]|nr:NUDIX domain-containing protein [Deltaproteobacteria bacterium]